MTIDPNRKSTRLAQATPGAEPARLARAVRPIRSHHPSSSGSAWMAFPAFSSPRSDGPKIQRPEIIGVGVGGVGVVPCDRLVLFPNLHQDLIAAYVYPPQVPELGPAIRIRPGILEDHQHGVPFRFRGLVLGPHQVLLPARLHRSVQGSRPELRVRVVVVSPPQVHLSADDEHRIVPGNRGQQIVGRSVPRDDQRFDPRRGRPVRRRLDVGRKSRGSALLLARGGNGRGQEEQGGNQGCYRNACSVHRSSLHYRGGGTAVISTPVIFLVAAPVLCTPGTGLPPEGGEAS